MSENRRYKYIVAEDEQLIRKNIIKKMEALSLPLLFAGEASNGMGAQRLLAKELPDIVITDIRMPGVDGLELAKHVHEQYPKVKTIIISGHSEFSYAQTAIKYHVYDYLLKPVSAESLQATLQHLLIALDSENMKLAQLAADPHTLGQDEICDLMTQYMRQNYQTDLSLGELAQKIGYTPEYIGKIFKKHTGETPSKFLAKLRINEAKYLLIHQPGLEIKKIGEMVGYPDAYYFSRIFKANTGMHPSEFRSGYQGSDG